MLFHHPQPHKILGILFVFSFTVLLAGVPLSAAVVPTPVKLLCEYKVDPIGIDVPGPRLSWQLEASGPGLVQDAYQIIAASSPAGLEEGGEALWDSGKVISSQSLHVRYGGKAPESRQRLYWKVRIWTGDGASGWSEPAFWEMGLLQKSDWSAAWIETTREEDLAKSEPSPLFRREFSLAKAPARARLYITSRGLYQAEINGKAVGDQVLTPGWTSYGERIQYQTYDVTGLLRKGGNAIGVRLGDGW